MFKVKYILFKNLDHRSVFVVCPELTMFHAFSIKITLNFESHNNVWMHNLTWHVENLLKTSLRWWGAPLNIWKFYSLALLFCLSQFLSKCLFKIFQLLLGDAQETPDVSDQNPSSRIVMSCMRGIRNSYCTTSVFRLFLQKWELKLLNDI